MAERPSFSPFWHRVRLMTPRLRPQVQITRQHYRGRRWHVAHDPSSNFFYRLNAVAYEFVGLLDGRRTVEEVWKHGLSRHGDEALTQNEVIQLLSQLYQSNLLGGDIQPETEQLLRRGRERLKKKAQQQAIGLMAFRIRLFNPDRVIGLAEPFLRPLIGRWGLLAWAVWMGTVLALVLPEWERLAGGFGAAVAPANWGWMLLVFVVLKLIHELGHGVVTKRYGAQVPEFGVMLLVLLPSPYVDASGAWGFADKWKRIGVGAGGMIFELAVAGAAALVWLNTEAGLWNQLAYNAMLTASISTVLFNANPLMKFDGYYMLSDLIEVPNLMPRSNRMLQFLFQKHYFRLREATAPTSDAGEALILLVFGVLSLAYRVFLFVSITLYVLGVAFVIGVLLAVWTAAMWFIVPVGKFAHWLATSPMLSDHRARTIWLSLLGIAAGLGVLGLTPFPDHRRAAGVVESRTRQGVYFLTPAFVESAHARAGDRVREGDPIVTTRSPELEAQLRAARAQLEEGLARETEATARGAALAQVAREYVAALREQVRVLEERERRLVVRAPAAGVVVGADPGMLLGAYVQEGQPLAEIVEPGAVRVTATLGQAEADWMKQLPPEAYRVRWRSRSDPAREVAGRTVRVVEAAGRELPHAALGSAGGGRIETDAADPEGVTSVRRHFEAHLEPAEGVEWTGLPGERVAVRFTLPRRPLLEQWGHRLRQTLQGRARL